MKFNCVLLIAFLSSVSAAPQRRRGGLFSRAGGGNNDVQIQGPGLGSMMAGGLAAGVGSGVGLAATNAIIDGGKELFKSHEAPAAPAAPATQQPLQNAIPTVQPAAYMVQQGQAPTPPASQAQYVMMPDGRLAMIMPVAQPAPVPITNAAVAQPQYITMPVAQTPQSALGTNVMMAQPVAQPPIYAGISIQPVAQPTQPQVVAGILGQSVAQPVAQPQVVTGPVVQQVAQPIQLQAATAPVETAPRTLIVTPAPAAPIMTSSAKQVTTVTSTADDAPTDTEDPRTTDGKSTRDETDN